MHIVMDMVNILLYKYIYFYADMFKYSLKSFKTNR